MKQQNTQQHPTTAEASSTDEFLTVEQVLARWQRKVTSATLATWRSRGNGPKFVKVGGRVLYRLADIVSWESKNTRN